MSEPSRYTVYKGELVDYDTLLPANVNRLIAESDLVALEDRVQEAIDLVVRYGGIDGSHHKSWCLDQVVRILAGERYESIVEDACDGEDGPDTYEWDVGIAP